MLIDISLKTSIKSLQLQFNKTTWCITNLYLKCLGKYNAGIFKKFIVRTAPEKAIDDTSIEDMVDVIAVTIKFDFDSFFQLTEKYDKKKMLLNTLQEGIMTIAQNQHWEIDPLMDAYNCCINRGLENRWLRKDKYFLSTDKKYYAGVLCNYDLDKFEAVASFLNKEKQEIKQVKLFETEPHMVEQLGGMGLLKHTHQFYLESKSKRHKWVAEPE
jgi:hypothetical protein